VDAADLISDRPIGPIERLQPAAPVKSRGRTAAVEATGTASPQQKRQVRLAKDFESILMTRMVEEMKNTVGQWGGDEEEDGASQQMQGIFWMHMAQHIGENGGIGLWKQIAEVMSQNDPSSAIDPSMDNRL
jgi:Rod binding domain-containing protein